MTKIPLDISEEARVQMPMKMVVSLIGLDLKYGVQNKMAERVTRFATCGLRTIYVD
jgi:hypothetical protein